MPVADRSQSPTDSDEKLLDIVVRIARLEERQSADREARNIAAKEIDRRLEGMNELRTQIATERGSYATKDWVEGLRETNTSRLDVNDERLAAVERRITFLESGDRANRKAFATMLGVAVLAVSLVAVTFQLIIR